MVETVRGDIFASGAEALVCPVNCIGVMGAGLAPGFKKRFPKESQHYVDWCKTKDFFPGDVLGARMNHENPYIFFAATKDTWRAPSLLMWVQSCAIEIRDLANLLRLKTIAVPALGCGKGELAWSDVEPWLNFLLKTCNANVRLYEPR